MVGELNAHCMDPAVDCGMVHWGRLATPVFKP